MRITWVECCQCLSKLLPCKSIGNKKENNGNAQNILGGGKEENKNKSLLSPQNKDILRTSVKYNSNLTKVRNKQKIVHTCPSELLPQAYTSPVDDRARVCSAPTAMSSMKIPDSTGTCWGLL